VLRRHARTHRQERVQVVREAVELAEHHAVDARERVVGEYGRDRDREAKAVMISASPTGPATLSMAIWPDDAMLISA